MNVQQRPNETRRKLAWIFAISLGIVLGIFIKRMHIGLIMGLVIGLLASNVFNKK